MKKLLSAILMMALLLCLTACRENASSITPGSNNSPQQESSLTPSDIKPETSEEPSGESHQSESESSEQSNPEQSEQPEIDPLEGLLVSEEFAKNPIWSSYSVNLMRDEKIYNLCGKAQNVNFQGYGKKTLSPDNRYYLRLYSPAKVSSTIWAVGDVPIPVFEPTTDKVAVFTTGELPPPVALTRAEYIGYTIPVCESYDILSITLDRKTGEFVNINLTEVQNMSMVGEAGAEIKIGDPLEENEKVLISWYEGINYHEIELSADYKLYQVRPELGCYEIEPTLTKNGYCELDVSSLPAGLYILPDTGEYYNSGLLEIR